MEFYQALDLVRAAMICLEAIPNPIYDDVDELLTEAYDALEEATGPLERAADEAANLEAQAIADDVSGEGSSG